MSLVDRTLGGFVVRERLGEGGFGEVYRAEQPILEREAVIKVLHVRHRGDRRVVQRFLREARLASRLDHPYAAHIYDFGAESDGLLWIAMEIVRGTPLHKLLAAQGPMPLDRFVPFFERLCEVVHSANEQGIVHRDIKPANVMVLARAGRVLPKLLDLGVARLVGADMEARVALVASPLVAPAATTLADSIDADVTPRAPRRSEPRSTTVTREGTLVGTPAYLAPELWSGGEPDPRCDQYALGVLAFEALTGQLPFTGATLAALGRAHAEAAVPSLPSRLPAAVHAVLARALAKHPGERYPGVLELAAALRAAAGLDAQVSVPQLDPELSERWTALSPQPVAEAVAALASTTRPEDVHVAAADVATALVRTLVAYAFATHGAVGRAPEPAAADLLRALRERDMDAAGWLELAQRLLRPLADVADACPLPELVRYFAGGAPAELPLAAGGRTVAEVVTRTVRALRDAEFLLDYPLVVPRAGRGDAWWGPRRLRRAAIALRDPDLPDGRPVLCGHDQRAALALWPLVQVAEPAPGAPEELFFFAGRGTGGARLVALPVGFERHDEEVWRWLGEELLPAGDLRSQDVRPPYLGLASFGRDDADLYVGREREAEAAANQLRMRSLLVVVGPSGAGKSSFVQAGVLPRLPPERRVIALRPGPEPMAALARAGAGTLDDLRAAPTVLVIDQLEELVTVCEDASARHAFAEVLGAAARSPDASLWVIVTLRDDFLVRLDALAPLRGLLARGLLLLTTPQPDQLLRILVEPARRIGYTFDDEDLPREMVAEVAERPGALALLSFTAAELWERRDRAFHKLTRKSYQALGGVGGALARHAEATLAELLPHERPLAREVFRHLVTAEGTRAAMARRELEGILGGGRVVSRMVEARLLVSSEAESGEHRIDIVHETLLTAWPRLVEWRREDAEGARLRDQLRQAARQWEDRDRPRGLLWRDDALAELVRWRARHPARLGAAEEAFADASQREAARGRRRTRLLVAVAFAMLALAATALVVQNQRTDAARRAAEARLTELFEEQGRQLALTGDAVRALPYLLQAYARGARGPGLLYLLARATGALETQRTVLRHEATVRAVQLAAGGAQALTASEDGTAALWNIATGQRLLTFRPGAQVAVALVTPDGQRVITAGSDNQVRVWDAASGEEVRALPATSPVRQMRMTRDGARLMTADENDKGRIWELATGRLIFEADAWGGDWSRDGSLLALTRRDGVATIYRADGRIQARLVHPARAYDAAFSPDGSLLAVTVHDGTWHLWRVADGEPVCVGRGHLGKVVTIEWDDTGERVVTGSEDHTARIWNADGCNLLHTLAGHQARINRVRFIRGGERVATASHDGTLRVWDTNTGQQRLLLAGHTAAVWGLAVAPDGVTLASASDDGTARIWDASREPLLAKLVGHKQRIRDVTFSPDGRRIASAAQDHTARLWDADSGRELLVLRHPDTVWTARFNPDGTRLVTVGEDGNARVWDAANGALLATLPHQGSSATARYTDDGSAILTLAADGKVRLWDAAGAQVRKTIDTGKKTEQATFDHAGRRLYTGWRDGADAWSADTGAHLFSFERPGERMSCLEVSPDDKLVAGCGTQRNAWLWDAATGRLVRALEGHMGWVTGLAFRRDGGLLATSSLDGTTRLWETSSGRLVGVLGGGLRWFDMVAYSPDGLRLVTAGTGNDIHVWDVRPETRTLEEIAPLTR